MHILIVIALMLGGILILRRQPKGGGIQISISLHSLISRIIYKDGKRSFQNKSFLIVSKNGNFLYLWNYIYNAVILHKVTNCSHHSKLKLKIKSRKRPLRRKIFHF